MDQNLDPSLPQPLTLSSHPPTPSTSTLPNPLSKLLPSSITSPDPQSLTTPPFTSQTNLTSSSLSSTILSCSDEFFAPASSLLLPTPPVFKPGLYVDTGKWMDGWETRRHNPNPFDWVLIRLGVAAGKVRGVEVDTAYFDGNHAPAVSVEGVYLPHKVGGEGRDEVVKGMATATATSDDGEGEGKGKAWRVLLGRKECGPSARHTWAVENDTPITHVRLRMYPDGGIARFRLYGTVVPVWPEDPSTQIELSAAKMGGVAVQCSDEHFGGMTNLLLPGRGLDMGDGWETKRSRGRRRGEGDWAVVRLGARGKVGRVVVDTMHFRGNFPRAVRVEGMDVGEEGWGEEASWKGRQWLEVVGEREMKADEEAECEIVDGVKGRVFSHLRLTMMPDGGVKRFRVFGTRV